MTTVAAVDGFVRRAHDQPVAVVFAGDGGAADDQHDVPGVAQVLERPDERLGFDDAGRSGPERGRRPDVRLARAHEIRIDERQVLDVVGDAAGVEPLQLGGVAGR